RSSQTRRACVARARHVVRPCLEALEGRMVLTGFLDPTFGAGGMTLTNFPGSVDDEGHGLVVQPDGKTIVAGDSGGRFELACDDADGRLEGSSGVGGRVVVAIDGLSSHGTVAVQSDGKIVVAGLIGRSAFSVVRLTAAGALDTTFDGDGVAKADLGPIDDDN